jgi:hypothetical protein
MADVLAAIDWDFGEAVGRLVVASMKAEQEMIYPPRPRS